MPPRSLLGLLALSGCGGVDLDDEAVCDGCDGVCQLETVPCDGADHVEGGVDYPDGPPACGDHDPCWTTWGVHETDPGDERWVHNLEHGVVVFLYDCADCDGEVAELAALVEGLPDAILAPYDGLPTRFAAVAWGVRLLTDCADRAALEDFYASYRDQAPESVAAMPPESCME